MATNWARVLAIPGCNAAKAVGAASEAGSQIHVAQTVDDGALAAVSDGGGGSQDCWCGRLSVAVHTAEVLKAGNIVAESSGEARC